MAEDATRLVRQVPIPAGAILKTRVFARVLRSPDVDGRFAADLRPRERDEVSFRSALVPVRFESQ
jgi:hypothetical protein